MKISIAKKASFSFFLIALLLIIIFTCIFHQTLSQYLLKDITGRLKVDIKQTTQEIDRILFECLSDISLITKTETELSEFISSTEKNEENEVRKVVNYLRHFEENRKIYSSMSIYGENGIKLGDTRGLMIGLDESNKDFFKEAMKGNIFNDSKPVMSQSLGFPVIHFSGPIKDTQGNIKGVIVARFPLGKLNGLIKNMIGAEYGQEIDIDLLDNEGLILYSSLDPEEILNNKTDEFEMIQKIMNSNYKREVTSFISRKSGQKRLNIISKQMGYSDFKGNNWILLASISTDYLFKPINDLTKSFYLLGLLLIIVTLPFIIIMSGKFSRPLIKLAKTAEQIGRGDFYQNIEVKTNDEIGDLAKAFSAMIDNLKLVTASRDELNKEIKERERVQESLRKQTMAVEQSPSTVMITDLKGKIEYVNPKFTKVTGYAMEEVLGKYPSILKSGNTPPEEYRRMWENITAGKEWRGEWQNRKKDGQLYWASVSITPVKDENGTITHFVELEEDVIERKKIERELIVTNETLLSNERALKNMLADLKRAHEELKNAQSQLLQTEKMAAIGQLAAGIAHEINNPTGYISSNLETLDKYVTRYSQVVEFAGKIKSAAKERDMEKIITLMNQFEELKEELDLEFISQDINNLLKESRNGIERIKKIVNDLRSFARSDQEQKSKVNINELLEAAINIVWNEIKYKVELKKEYGQVPPLVCNPQKIEQVIINLLINAVHAISDKGTIKITTSVKNEYACIEIEDSGCGIPQPELKKIFDPFYTTKEVGKGTGLGLSISYDIIKKHGGEIMVESEVNKGTKFTITLPFMTKAENANSGGK